MVILLPSVTKLLSPIGSFILTMKSTIAGALSSIKTSIVRGLNAKTFYIQAIGSGIKFHRVILLNNILGSQSIGFLKSGFPKSGFLKPVLFICKIGFLGFLAILFISKLIDFLYLINYLDYIVYFKFEKILVNLLTVIFGSITLTSKVLGYIGTKGILTVNNYLNKDLIKLIAIENSKKMEDGDSRVLVLTYQTSKGLPLDKSLELVFNNLKISDEFLNFGVRKIIIVSAITSTGELMLHRNVLIDNNTTFEEYYSKIKDDIVKFSDPGYNHSGEIYTTFRAKIWNVDLYANTKIKRSLSTLNMSKRSYSTLGSLAQDKTTNFKITGYINPLPPNKNKNLNINPIARLQNLNPIAALDIETITFEGLQLPIYISLTYNNSDDLFYNQTKSFMINTSDAQSEEVDIQKASLEMFKELFKYIELYLHPKTTIFVHNLGSFDGYFIFKNASMIYHIKLVKSIIDNENKFILINIKQIKFVDSYRIFAVSLNGLCDVFNHGEGKTSSYNSDYNSLNIFRNDKLLSEFRTYADNDSIILYKCMLRASILYMENYDVDISQVVSMSSLSMLIFRKNFLKVKIPILNHKLDDFVRDSYYGGATDYYIKYAKKVYYYDVNSLYPFAMLKYLPLKPIKWIDDSVKLSDFFGFALVKVHCPLTVKKPILPKKHKGKTIFPTGSWIGVYFSEELKAVEKYGYKVEIIKGLEFSKAKIFTDYIDHFYEIKKTSTGPLRFIGKNHLNYLYGLFGRLKTVLETITILNTEIEFYLVSRIIKNIIKIDDEKSVLLTMQNIDTDIVSELNSTLETELLNYESIVKTNVAIASAVTANARIHMIPFKISNETCYTDTDSVFTTLELPNNLIGEDIGGYRGYRGI